VQTHGAHAGLLAAHPHGEAVEALVAVPEGHGGGEAGAHRPGDADAAGGGVSDGRGEGDLAGLPCRHPEAVGRDGTAVVEGIAEGGGGEEGGAECGEEKG